MNKKFRKLILPASILAASQAYALGLGDLQVNSALDEVLDGQIPIIVDSDEDISNIKVALASSEDYQRVDLDKSYVPSNIQVEIIDENNTKYIVVSSVGPVSEPIVSLLLSVDWANGHLLREYTILLDPPLFNTSQTPQNYSDPVQTNTYEAPADIKSKNQTIPQNNVDQSYRSNSNSQVVVESGDTLWKIAGNVNNGIGTQQQMMVALFNNNPTAFTNNDMNRLKKGAILNVPNADDVSMISNGEAVAEVKSHLQNWSNLQTQDDGSDNYDSSASPDYGIELIPPSDSDSSNSTNTSGSSSDSNNRNKAELSRLKEELASSNLENEELSSRVDELEQIIKDQDLALSLKDNNLAQLQDQIANSNESDTIIDTIEDDTVNDDVWGETNTDEVTATDSDTLNKDQGDLLSTDDLTNSDDELTATDDIVITDSSNSDEVENTTQDESVEVNTPTSTQNVTPTVQEKSLLDKVLDYKFEGLIGLGALILAGLAFIFIRRRGSDDDGSEDGGGFLDSISNNNDKSEEELLGDGELSTELDNEDIESLNLDDEITELNELTEDEDLLEDEIEGDEVPEVVVMDDQSDDDAGDLLEEEESLFMNSEDDLSDELDLEIDDMKVDQSDVDSELNELDFSDTVGDDDDLNIDDLSLDLDIDDLDVTEEGLEPEESTENESDDENHLDDNLNEGDDITDEDFSLDLDLDTEVELDDIETDDQSESEDEEQFSLDFDVDDLDLDNEDDNTEDDLTLTDVDLTAEESIINDNQSDESEEFDDSLSFDLSDELDLSDDLYDSDDISLEKDESESQDSEFESVSIDTDADGDDVDIGLDLDDVIEEDVDIGLDFDDIIEDDAIDTKLDLAKAYFEMGDIDGAKQMVVEIIEEGNEEQKVKAEELKNEIEG